MTKYQWFRLYSFDILANTKFLRLPKHERCDFITLLALANNDRRRGCITDLDDDDIAYELELDVQDWQALKAKLRTKGLIELIPGGLAIAGWEEKQYDKPSDRPEAVKERVKKHRQKKSSEAGNAPVTPCNALETPSNATVTPLSRDATLLSRDVTPSKRIDQIRTEQIRSEADTEKENKTADAVLNFSSDRDASRSQAQDRMPDLSGFGVDEEKVPARAAFDVESDWEEEAEDDWDEADLRPVLPPRPRTQPTPEEAERDRAIAQAVKSRGNYTEMAAQVAPAPLHFAVHSSGLLFEQHAAMGGVVPRWRLEAANPWFSNTKYTQEALRATQAYFDKQFKLAPGTTSVKTARSHLHKLEKEGRFMEIEDLLDEFGSVTGMAAPDGTAIANPEWDEILRTKGFGALIAGISDRDPEYQRRYRYWQEIYKKGAA